MLAAVLPAIILLCYVYRQDTIEKEPPFLLFTLFLFGVLSAICASVLEGILQQLLAWLVEPGTVLYTVLLAFFVVAMVEEGVKLLFLKLRTWEHPAFNYRFDGIIYAVFVSLGFAAYENIFYVLQYGLSVALPRALLAVPGHMSFAVFMGIFYGRAKLSENRGRERSARYRLRSAYIWPVFLHGFYDACAMIGGRLATITFFSFVALMFLLVWRSLKRESFMDVPV